jgi:hypothetical protein
LISYSASAAAISATISFEDGPPTPREVTKNAERTNSGGNGWCSAMKNLGWNSWRVPLEK